MIDEIKDTLGGMSSRLEGPEEQIIDLEDRVMENTQLNSIRKKDLKEMKIG